MVYMVDVITVHAVKIFLFKKIVKDLVKHASNVG